jgi:transcriptional regulator with XRE-family HTH domain
MKAAGKTDEEIAPAVGVSRVQITRIRNRTNIPSQRTALALEKITGIPAGRFLTEERRSA